MSKKDVFELEIKVGNDNGNSEQDIVINGEVIQQPNVYSKVSKLPKLDELNQQSFIENIHENLIVTITSKAINDGTPTSYFVSTYAMKSGKMLRNIEVGAFNSKLTSDVPLINTSAQIAGYAVKQMFAKGKVVRDLHIKVDMTTALPVTQYDRNKANEFSNRFMDEPYEVIVHVPNDSFKVTVEYVYVKTLPESVPSVFYLQNTTDNRIFKNTPFNAEFFKNKRILHIAIGEGTTEYPLTNDISFDPNFIKGSNNGVGHAIKQVLDEFITENRLTKYSRQDFSNALRDETHKYHESALENIQDALEEQAEIIYRHAVDEVGKANNDVDIIMVHGGGSILMNEYLKDQLLPFVKATNITLFYIPSNFAVVLEALGMYEFTNGDIFKALKAKKIEANLTKA